MTDQTMHEAGGAAETDYSVDAVGDGGEPSLLGGAGGDPGAGGGAAGLPDAYALDMPEGFTLDGDTLAEADPVFREMGLSNDAAQKLVPVAAGFGRRMFDAGLKQAGDRLMSDAATTRREWADAFEADPEFGGPNRARTLSEAARAFDHYGLKAGEGLRQLLDESGLGNHPDLIRFVAQIGRDLGEGSFERGDAVRQPRAAEQKLYGAEFQAR